jgi:hypothetical protein
MKGAFGDVECIPVPLKDFLSSFKLGEQRIAFRLVRWRNVIPADFFFLVWVNGPVFSRSIEHRGKCLTREDFCAAPLRSTSFP